uniref:Uncharacterized protein n=1 Tax=Klebsiella pneumoniae TaxID=573 RepID=A0A8B0SU11_KLEPN|nr:hypothetical protein [Klebsiella pneumoniae]
MPCFYGSESRDSADVRQCFLPLRTTPSVAEQEGHLMEMEATRTARWDITPRGNTGSGHR